MPSSSRRKRSSLWRTRSSCARRSVRSRVILEAAQLALRVEQRGDNHVGPEARAILAHAPALDLEAADARGFLDLAVGPAGGDRFGRVEDREVLADDVVGGISLDALRAGVPGRDAAVGIEQEDGVVLHALDQHAEALFARAQAL